MPRSFTLVGLLGFVLILACTSETHAQIGFMGGGGTGAGSSFRTNWPRFREYRDLSGQSYTDTTPTGRKGYFVPLTSPGLDDLGNGPSMAFSPIFNAPQRMEHPIPLTGEAPAQAAASPGQRPPGLFRRIFRGS